MVTMGTPALKRLAAMTALVWLFCLGMAVVGLFAQTDTPLRPEKNWVESWVTPQNLVTLAVLIYGWGVLREQFEEQKRRTDRMEKWRDEVAPKTFASQAVTDERFDHLHARLERVEQAQAAHR